MLGIHSGLKHRVLRLTQNFRLVELLPLFDGTPANPSTKRVPGSHNLSAFLACAHRIMLMLFLSHLHGVAEAPQDPPKGAMGLPPASFSRLLLSEQTVHRQPQSDRQCSPLPFVALQPSSHDVRPNNNFGCPRSPAPVPLAHSLFHAPIMT